MLSLVLLFTSFEARSRNPAIKNSPGNQLQSQVGSGTLQKMIVQNGSVTMDLDLNRLNGIGAGAQNAVTLQFAVAANSFFSVLVFNDLLRGPEEGSMALLAQSGNPSGFPAALSASINHLVVEKLPTNDAFDLAVRDGNTGFTFFNIEGHQYDYDANAQLLRIRGGRLLVSKELAKSLGRPSDIGAIVGKISIGAIMQAIEITQLDQNGDVKSARLPALKQPGVGTVPGPDVIIGELIGLQQLDSGAVNGRVGISFGTDACNKGTIDVDWFALPSNDHPFIPQNVYRMSGGADNSQQFEQIGQSWGKHAFTAASSNTCGFGCNGVGGSHLGSGCSDAYGAGLNGSQTGIGSRAWVNPFTGSFVGSTANNHSGHVHDVTSHRILVDTNDLIPAQNQGATYFAEAQYIVPHEYTWCQSHPGQCNMYNNASYHQYTVSGGPTTFSFGATGITHREQPAIMAWTGATVTQLQPDPGNDGIWFMGYKVSNPSTGVWHYEYALYNQNLDRAIQSFSVPIGSGVNISNIGFHAPIQHPGWANDGTFNNQGYSSTPWTVTQASDSITWNSETFAQNQNANAIRYGTLYNFRFDADQAPNPTNSTVGFFKTGSPMPAVIMAPGNVPAPSPTPTPTASPTPTFTPTPTPTPVPCGGFTIIQIGGSIVPGTTDTGNHCDDCTTLVTLPFPFTLYGNTYTSVNLSSNGNAQFTTTDTAFTNQCLPWTGHDYTIFPYWDDLYTVNSGFGIFTSISGTAPNRIFNIEWRAQYFPGSGNANFELRLYEGQTRFDVIYGTVSNGNTSATAGLQRDDNCFAQYFCNGVGGPPTGGWSLAPAGTPTPTPTATATATPMATATATATPTPTSAPCSVISPNPACNSTINTQPVDFVINLSDAVNTSTVQASDFTVNGTPSNLAPTFSNGNTTITFHYSTSPVVQGQNTMHIAACAFNCGNGCVQEFTCTFFYEPPTPTPTATATATATTTVPPSPTPTATATATPTSTPRPSVTPRPSQAPRPRPTPPPRPV